MRTSSKGKTVINMSHDPDSSEDFEDAMDEEIESAREEERSSGSRDESLYGSGFHNGNPGSKGR